MSTVAEHKFGTHAEWLSARVELLQREKELTRLRDDLAQERRQLPWVRVDKPYTFETETGTKSLAELFDGRSQLLVYHFMLGPDWTEGCPSCSFWADSFDGTVVHLEHRDVTMLCASRAPLESIEAYKRRMGWTFPWVSSLESDFNFDFHVSFTEEQRSNGAEQLPSCREAGRGAARPERLRARGRHRLPHLLLLRTRARHHQQRLPAARLGAEGARRGRPLVHDGVAPPPRRVRGSRLSSPGS